MNYLVIGNPTELELALSFSRSLSNSKVHLDTRSVLKLWQEKPALNASPIFKGASRVMLASGASSEK